MAHYLLAFSLVAQPNTETIAAQREPAAKDSSALSLAGTKMQNYSQKWPTTTLAPTELASNSKTKFSSIGKGESVEL